MSASLRTIGPVMLVGAGKMGRALARGWLDAGLPPNNLVLVDPSPGPEAKALAQDYELPLYAEAAGLLPNVLVLAVKPQIIGPVMEALQPVIGPKTLVVSIAAGIDLARLTRGLDTGRVVRTMPNTPAQVGKGVTGAVAGPDVDADERATVDALLAAAGMVVWLDSERDLDALTGVSGSGPAYVFNMVEAMAAAGVQQGLSPEIAMKLARQTVIGAAALMEAEPTVPAATLRQNVTSPNGTTAAALAVLMADNGLTPLMERAVAAARKRTEELGRE